MIHVKTLIKAIPSNLMNQFQIIGWVQIIKDCTKLLLMHIVYRNCFFYKKQEINFIEISGGSTF